MAIPGADLLKLLAPSAGAQRTSTGALLQQLAQSDSFQNILEKARAGSAASGIAVKTTKDAGVTLTQDQLQRLAAAADIAEANGAARAVFLIDGQALRMDVGTRTILGPVDTSATGVLSDIDAIVTVAARGAEAQHPPLTPPTGSAANLNVSLLRALAERA